MKGAPLVALLLAVASLAAAGPDAPRGGDGGDGRSKVAADLAARMDAAGPGERLPVVVRTAEAWADPGAAFPEAAGAVGHAFHAVPGFAAALTPGQVERLAERADVLAVEWDAPVHAMMSTAAPSFGAAGARSAFGVDGDRDGAPRSYVPDDVVVCVIDTGIDAGHVDLDGGKVLGWRDFVGGRPDPYDDHGHGTHVAGTVAGDGDGNPALAGVAPGAALVGVKVLDRNGSGSTSNVIAGVQWCIDQRAALGIDVISMSLGSSGSSSGGDTLSLTVNAAFDAGIVPVVAAGNSGPAKRTIGSPAAAAKAITVGAMGDTGEDGFFLAYFSSRGPTADGRTKPDIAGPGWAITAARANTASGYATLSGTSMATPFVSGTVALMLDADPGLAPEGVRDALARTAQDWGRPGKDDEYGEGRLRSFDAVRDVLGSAEAGPAEPSHLVFDGLMMNPGQSEYHTFLVRSTAFPIALTLVIDDWTSFGPNLNVYLYAPGADTSRHGEALASGTGSTRQETVRVRPPAEGTYTVEVTSVSGAGRYVFDVSAGEASRDAQPPVTTASLAGDAGAGGWWRSTVTATLDAADDQSGVTDTWFRLDGGVQSRYMQPVAIGGDGHHTLEYWSVDGSGNVEPARGLAVRVDSQPPSTTDVLDGPLGLEGWHTGPVLAVLAAADTTSGVEATLWAVDGGPERAYGAPVELAAEGEQVLAYRSRDAAGNEEPMRERRVRVDSEPPATTAVLTGTPGAAGWWRSDVAVALAAADATSGVRATRQALDGGAWSPYAGPVTVAGDGRHALAFASTDVAGNAEEERLQDVAIDTAPPATTLALAGPAGRGGWFVGPVRATLAAADATSGVAATEVAVGGAAAPYDGPLTLGRDGRHDLTWRSTDVAGNVEALRAAEVRVDQAPPATALRLEGPEGDEGWFLGPVALRLEAEDATSGVASTEVRVDGVLVGERPPVVAGDGAHDVAYGSTDVAGNAEPARAASLRIDATPPVSGIHVGEPRAAGDHLYVDPTTPFTLHASDARSGVRDITYAIDGGDPQPYGGPFTLAGPDGPRSVAYWARDRAGNVEARNELAVFLDATAPDVRVARPVEGSVSALDHHVPPLAPLPVEKAVVVAGTRLEVRVDALDPPAGGGASGVASVALLLDGAPLAMLLAPPYAFLWDTAGLATGDHVLTAVATDRLGHARAAPVRLLAVAMPGPPAPPAMPGA